MSRKSTRTVSIECSTPHLFIRMHLMCDSSPKMSGCERGSVRGEFIVLDEYRFGLLKQACEAKEIM